MNDEIRSAASERGVTRLCHLTPFANLVHIAAGEGLRATCELSADERACFDQQDLLRLDRHTHHISCSIEYPNGWYLRQRHRGATPVQRLAPDWVCLALDPRYLWHPQTRFCVRNAAAESGSLVRDGRDAFNALYGSPVSGAGGSRHRLATRIPSCPTDDQAEVLVSRHIELEDVRAVIGATNEQIMRIYYGLRQVGGRLGGIRFVVAPDLFDPVRLSRMLAEGERPAELEWRPE